MTFEDTITLAVERAVEKVLREREPALVAAIAARLGNAPAGELRSVEQAAAELGIGEGTVRTMVKERRVRVYRTPGGTKRSGKMRVDVGEVKLAMAPAGSPVPEKDIEQKASEFARKLIGR